MSDNIVSRTLTDNIIDMARNAKRVGGMMPVDGHRTASMSP